MNPEVAEDKPSASSRSTRSQAAFETEMLTFGSQTLRVGRMPAKGGRDSLTHAEVRSSIVYMMGPEK